MTGEKSNGFEVKIPDVIFDLDIYKYLVKGDFYETDGGNTTSKGLVQYGVRPYETLGDAAKFCSALSNVRVFLLKN